MALISMGNSWQGTAEQNSALYCIHYVLQDKLANSTKNDPSHSDNLERMQENIGRIPMPWNNPY